MCLQGDEFVRRFLLHVLPLGFQRIRQYGLLANCTRKVKLERCRQLLNSPAPMPSQAARPQDYRDRYQRLTGLSLRDCPACGKGQMILFETLAPIARTRGPPWIGS